MSEAPDSKPGFADLGRRLRDERNRRGLSIQQVAERIHVAPRYLEAIEAGDEKGIPAPVYIRGFVAGYARALGLDETPFTRMVDELKMVEPPQPEGQTPAPPPYAFRARKGKAESTGGSRKKATVARRYLVMAGAVLLAGLLVGLGIRGVVRLVTHPGGNGGAPSPFEGGTAGGKAVVPAPKQGVASGAEKSRAMKPFAVSVTALEDCWMQTQVDNGRAVELDLKAGDTQVFQASEKVRLYVGNAGGVKISGPAGPVALPAGVKKVVNLLITRDGFEKLRLPQPVSSTPATAPSAQSAPAPSRTPSGQTEGAPKP